MTVSRRRYAIRSHPDMTVEAERGGLSLLRMTTVQVASGRGPEWEQFMRSSLPTFANADVAPAVYERAFSPGPSAWLIVENFSSFAHLEQPSVMFRAFGEQAGAATGRFAGLLTSIERTVLRLDAELSYSPLRSSSR